MPGAIVIRHAGGPDVLRWESARLDRPTGSSLRLRHTAIGVNFHDVYVRSGLYSTLALPGVPGIEAVGVIEAVGDEVTRFKPGDRVAYVTPRYGAYSDERLIDASEVIGVPDELDDRSAAAVLLKGLTAWMLLSKHRALALGDTCLIHAAAGGVGRLLSQWASHLGAAVIGTVGSEEKAKVALRSGCDHVIQYRRENVCDRVRELTKGRGVDVVYDSVGADTFAGSLECLATRGQLICFGQSSGPVKPLSLTQLAAKSLSVWRPTVFHYLDRARERDEMARRLFSALRAGVVTTEIGAEFPLGKAADAHRTLEGRAVAGSIILIP